MEVEECVVFPNLAFGGRKRRKGVVSGRRKRARSLQESEVVLLLLLHIMLKGCLINLSPCIIDGVGNKFMRKKINGQKLYSCPGLQVSVQRMY